MRLHRVRRSLASPGPLGEAKELSLDVVRICNRDYTTE
jgi:hypothetical protein